MKLTLDLDHPKLPKLFWLVLLLVVLWTIICQMPASWLGSVLASQTGCRVMLQQASGSIWQGSAALAFSEPNATEGGCREPLSVTERFHWASSCSLSSLSCFTELQFVALNNSQIISWGLKKIQIGANEVKLPANVLEGLGNPWSTLRPRGQLAARWTDLVLGGILRSASYKSPQSGVIRIIISNLSSPISPIKPLGSYEISANIGDEGLKWNLSTTNGPLLLRGQGDIKSGLHFDGEASASPEAQDSLIGLLALLGKREGAVYRLKF